jgi:hypothetical protein
VDAGQERSAPASEIYGRTAFGENNESREKQLSVLLGRRGAARWNARTLFRRQQRHQDVSFHPWHRFDLAVLADFPEEPVHLGAAHFLVRHFAATVKNHGANFVAFPEKPDNLILANLIIVFRGCRTKLYFLQLRAAAALALLVGLFALLVEEFAVIRDLADWRIRGGRDFHQVQSSFAGHFHGLERLHYSKLATLFINNSDFARPDPFVDADAVGLPEIPFSDKSPLAD